MLKNLIRESLYRIGYEINLSPVGHVKLNKQIAFIHIAKCGGISVDSALRRLLAQPQQPRLCRTTSIAASVATYKGLMDSIDDTCDFSEHHLKILKGILDHFLTLNHQYISGHWPVDSTLIESFSHKTDFITLLRDPVSRFKSNYIFNKLSNPLSIMKPNNLKTDDLIAEAREIIFGRRGWQMANTQTAYIVGQYPKNVDDCQNLQEQFLLNIKKFKLVGFLEDITNFESQFKSIYGMKLQVREKNKTSSQQKADGKSIISILNNYLSEPNVEKHIREMSRFERENVEKAKEWHFDK
ncbi:sulfotransferase family 2 domain-containing protein [Pseudoalteromonas xiamenensis]|uniref:hypothetical protein n=1 Tax=Pseudoalteromonas xiamenensis TaxID=882626 RepID=UPI0027E56629|nr:hypothetical protein [Pseudoalteromonas xiamenensis]WMN61204.1 sulfotransferase family 2 domain-containing protein [Pseudoalteromonas xiamenensis]